jgi:hypothetical protein
MAGTTPGHDEPVIANASDSVLAVRPRFWSLATIALLAGRINRRKDAVVDRASLSNQASALKLGFRNELNDFAHAVPAMIQELGGIPAAPHASKPY